MRFIKSNRKRFLIFLAVCAAVMLVSYVRTISVIPERITLLEGQEYVFDFKSPFLVNIKADKNGVVKVNNGDTKTNGSYFRLSEPISLKTQTNGSVNLNVRIFGLIPLRTMKVDIVPNKKIAACGSTIGVKLKTEGILVIGISDVDTVDGKKLLPARDSGIKQGDLIVEVNKKKPDSIDDLVKEIDKSQGEKISIKYKRSNVYFDAEVIPVKAVDDKKYHIGLWVRDSTAGIGTLTFFDPQTKGFAALGHGITDIDTGALMPVDTGDILESNILAIKKGRQGSPGELKGVFVEDRNKLGAIDKNCDCGIYGTLNDDAISRIPYKLYSVGMKSQVKEGAASILANIDGKKVEEYNIEIQKVSRQSLTGSKGMIIKITDKRLLDATGGIVQGMSGSPIIQDNKIIGAVTHVLVNDPTRGYGIFIEAMVKNLMGNNIENLGNAA